MICCSELSKQFDMNTSLSNGRFGYRKMAQQSDVQFLRDFDGDEYFYEHQTLSSVYLRDTDWISRNQDRILSDNNLPKTIGYSYLSDCLFDPIGRCHIRIEAVSYFSRERIVVFFTIKSRSTGEVIYFAASLETALPSVADIPEKMRDKHDRLDVCGYIQKFTGYFSGKVFRARRHYPIGNISEEFICLEILYNFDDLKHRKFPDFPSRFIARAVYSPIPNGN